MQYIHLPVQTVAPQKMLGFPIKVLGGMAHTGVKAHILRNLIPYGVEEVQKSLNFNQNSVKIAAVRMSKLKRNISRLGNESQNAFQMRLSKCRERIYIVLDNFFNPNRMN